MRIQEIVSRYRVPVIAAAGLVAVILIASFWGGTDDTGGDQLPPPLPPPLQSELLTNVVIVFDVSGSMKSGLRARLDEAIRDVKSALVGILCSGKVPPGRWRSDGTLPDLHRSAKEVAILSVGAPNRSRPFFRETKVGRLDAENCGRVVESVPRALDHPLSYLELGKAEAVELFPEAGSGRRYLIMVSDFVEGPATQGVPEWDSAVNRYLTSYQELTLYSAAWEANGRLKIRVIEVSPRSVSEK